MPEVHFTFGVWLFIGIALSISAVSLYVSRWYLPMKMRSAYRKSITALAAAVETKDSGTVGHAQRVAQLTVAVASGLGLRGEMLQRIEYAALLMDIGKANVPQAVLNKKDPLSEEEWEMVKSHARLGSEMAAAVPFLADLQGYILHHHEYWDGTGYPNGLKGEEIPLVSRILAIAADYDAMVSVRPYHARPLSHEEALDEINRHSGTRYDPRVCKVFMEIIKSTVDTDVAA